LIISCAADPAVEILRNEASVPIIGAGSAMAHAALSASSRIGVIGIGATLPANIENILGEKCIGYRQIPEVHKASKISPQATQTVLDQAEALIDQGAGAILLACAGLAAIGAAQKIYNQFGVISVDPVHAAGSLTHHILSVTRRRISSDG